MAASVKAMPQTMTHGQGFPCSALSPWKTTQRPKSSQQHANDSRVDVAAHDPAPSVARPGNHTASPPKGPLVNQGENRYVKTVFKLLIGIGVNFLKYDDRRLE